MNCRACANERIKSQRPYQSVPRQMKYTTTMGSTEPQEFFTSMQGHRQTHNTPTEGDLWYMNQEEPETYPFEPCFTPTCCPLPSSPNTFYCCPQNSEYGFFSSIRNGFQKIFNGNGNRKRNSSPLMCKDKVYRYSASQLKIMEKHLCKLEDEAACVEEIIKEALNNFCVNKSKLKGSVSKISDQLTALKWDLNCALECYDSCRDKYEFELICSLIERATCLESLIYDLCLQLNCLESYPTPYGNGANCRKPCCAKRTVCKPNCKKPCCYRPPPPRCEPCRPPYDINLRRPPCPPPQRNTKCQKPCCTKGTSNNRPRKWRPHGGKGDRTHYKAGLCRTSSVIPLGVMLVKL